MLENCLWWEKLRDDFRENLGNITA
jgi:hypothetical protein